MDDFKITDSQKQQWLEKAAELRPELFKRTVSAERLLRLEKDEKAFHGWRTVDLGKAEKAYDQVCQRELEYCFDFGEYCVGYLSFDIEIEGVQDSPLRLQVLLGEVPAELGEDFSKYQGNLSKAWLQEELLVLEHPEGPVHLPRRYAFRYVRFTYAYGSAYKVKLKNVRCETVTSADVNAITPLPDDTTENIKRIDRISLNTLKNCMQTVFEDGPKRDRRLWLGDFRLQALVNYSSFKNYDLCKRCLYLFAGLTDESGLISSCLYESPQPRIGEAYIYDYTALFVPTLLEYAEASGDWDTANELWPVVVRQLEIVLVEVDENGLFQDNDKWWLFIDWELELDKQASEQGILIYCLKKACELGRALNRENEIAEFETLIDKMSQAAIEKLFDKQKDLFVSGESRQISWASQVWMVIAGVLPPEQARLTLAAIEAEPDARKPAGPYLYHYVVEAMLIAGMEAEANSLLEKYWGAMAKLGADNFWEVFDPEDQYRSPYRCHLINSYCHAWSCTPSYFIRRQKESMNLQPDMVLCES